MRMQPDNSSESRIASGLKAAALVVLLGLIAVVSEPVLHSRAVADHGLPLAATTSATAPASTGDGATYFPDQYPAPTKVEELPPTF